MILKKKNKEEFKMEILLKDTVIQLLGIIIGGCLAVASAYGSLLIARATQKIKLEIERLNDETQKRILNDTLDRVDSLLQTNIIAMENTVKKDMLASIADGKIEKAELKTLADNVKNNVLKQLGNDSLAVLNDSLGDVNGYLEVKIEEILAQIKAQ